MRRNWILAVSVGTLAGCASTNADLSALNRIEHIVVIYAENRSFDHLYGSFPGAEGIAQASVEQKTQVDLDGKPLSHLPPVYTGASPT